MELQYCKHAFNNDTTILDTIKMLVDTFKINYIIETGTHEGYTTENLAINCPTLEIDTIEINNEFYNNSKNKLSKYSSVNCLMGSSDTILSVRLPNLISKNILFYLDAHWGEDWPLLNELEYISQNFKDNCCIVIDDFKVPNRNFNYDTYKNTALNLDYVKDHINKIFKEPFYFFNDKTNRRLPDTNQMMNAVGKIYIYPAEWNSKFKDLPFKSENGFYYAL